MKNLTNLSILLFVVFIGCSKNPITPQGSLDESLRMNIWQLKSASKHYNNGNNSRYLGNVGDSIWFQYAFDSNINIVYTNIVCYVHDTTIVTNGYRFLDWSLNTPHPYDTIVCSQPWQPYCSDSLFVSAFTGNSVVINVKFRDNIGSGIEVDSLKSIRVYWP